MKNEYFVDLFESECNSLIFVFVICNLIGWYCI